MTYNKDQLLTIVPFITTPPEWFILGGPSDGNEAQCAKRVWPSLEIIAIEPLLSNVEWQYNNAFPSDAVMVTAAIGKKSGPLNLYINSDPKNGHRCSSITVEAGEDGRAFVQTEVTTLDKLDDVYGPFARSLLWLDIEGAEYDALLGAVGLFEREKIDYVNVEVMSRNQNTADNVHKFLTDRGFKLTHTWNVHYELQKFHHCDKFYARK